jgi:prepilin-type N-terminal cleavage/methylation domain-containing protein
MKNNRGYTVIELVVVVAIMAVLLGVFAVGFNSLSNQKTRTASKKVFNTLGSAQTFAMSKGNTYYGVIYEDKKIMVCVFYKANDETDYQIVQSAEINNTVEVSFKNTSGNRYYIGDSSRSDATTTYCSGVIIPIDRSTGQFKSAYFYSGNQKAPQGSEAGTCSNIYVGTGNKENDIVLVALTGKFFYNNN